MAWPNLEGFIHSGDGWSRAVREKSHPTYHDRMRTCHLAHWHKVSRHQLEYGIAGHDPCAVVEVSADDAGTPCSYTFYCSVDQRSIQGQCEDESACIIELLFWLRTVDCPGKLTGADQPEPAHPSRIQSLLRRLAGSLTRRESQCQA